jgi:hypothetical protein
MVVFQHLAVGNEEHPSGCKPVRYCKWNHHTLFSFENSSSLLFESIYYHCTGTFVYPYAITMVWQNFHIILISATFKECIDRIQF